MRQPHRVYIIESPSADDLLVGREDGQSLETALQQAGIPVRKYVAVDQKRLANAFALVGTDILENSEYRPVIHVSAHGSDAGVGLTDGTFIPWESFRGVLIALNQAVSGNLILGMSACKGFHALKISSDNGAVPFGYVVGPTDDIGWQDSLIGFLVFYHQLIHKGRSPEDAERAMGPAAGLDRSAFYGATGNLAQAFVKEINEQKMREAVRKFVAQLNRNNG